MLFVCLVLRMYVCLIFSVILRIKGGGSLIKIYHAYIKTFRQAYHKGGHHMCLLMGVEHPLLSVTAHLLMIV